MKTVIIHVTRLHAHYITKDAETSTLYLQVVCLSRQIEQMYIAKILMDICMVFM